MPNPLSWFFHHLPRPLHRVEVFGNFAAQLVLPFGLFLAAAGGVDRRRADDRHPAHLVASGNYAWLNWLTIVILCSSLADRVGRVHELAAPSSAPCRSGSPWPCWRSRRSCPC